MLFAVAFSLVLKVVRFWNFAQAGLMGLAFYGMFAARVWAHLPLPVSILVGLSLTIVAALIVEVYGLRTLRARKSVSLMFFIFALVVSELLAYLLQIVFGTEPLTIGDPGASAVNLIFGVVVTQWDLQAIVVTVVLLALLHLFIRKTRDGQSLAAVADNPDLSRLYGVDVKRAYVITFVAASILITAGMYLFGTRASILPHSSFHLMIFAVICTLLAGIGRVFGAAVAGGALSLIQGLSVVVMPSEWQGLVLYAILFIAILFFPRGVGARASAGKA